MQALNLAYMIPLPSVLHGCYHVPSRAGNDDWLVPQVNAVAYDNPIPGFGTNNVTNLRLFESQPVNEFNLDFFNEGNFDEVSVQKAPPRQSPILNDFWKLHQKTHACAAPHASQLQNSATPWLSCHQG